MPAEELADEETEEKKMSDFLKRTNFKLDGMQNFSKMDLKKTILGVFSRDNPNNYKPLKTSNGTLDKLFIPVEVRMKK
jgi:hypothetical protein